MLAAVLLCAGKGTRMNDDSTNKVCFPCAGIPVIKRIINNLRAGGVDTFVIVVGHHAQAVMEALGDEQGVIYAFQKEQKGTGHAALCGLSALKNAGFHGRAVISMGDKIISPDVIRGLITADEKCKAVWGVQPLSANYNGGRVVTDGKKAYGVVELADAALMSLAGVPEASRAGVLKNLRINEKKAEKILAKAKNEKLSGEITLGGRVFTADDILNTPYANAGLYCFDVDAAVDAILKCDSANAQGEIYLTDTLSMFAEKDEAVLYEVSDKSDMLTYSTKPELRAISSFFCRSASEFAASITDGAMDDKFNSLYDDPQEQKARYLNLISLFMQKYGDKKIVITRAPGRVNLMGRHIDHRGGSVNVVAINRDMVMVASPREDDTVRVTYSDGAYPDSTFSVSELLSLAPHENWLDYLESDKVKEALRQSKGDATNYVKSAILRLRLESNIPLCGMDIVLGGTIPMAVGLSSSSAIVVAAAEAVCFLNNLNLTPRQFVELCGEGEWFVGSRGGAADHAAMKCCSEGHITHLSFKPFTIGESVPFSDKFALIIANSMQMAKKSEGCKDKYNEKVAASDIALFLLKKKYPEYNLKEFRDIAKVPTHAEIYDMLLSLPVRMSRSEIFSALPGHRASLERIFSNHSDPGFYAVRGVALFGISECMRAEKCTEALKENDYKLLGDMMKISHCGDSVTDTMPVDDETIRRLSRNETPLYLVAGAYECSTERIDGLCNLLNSYDGVLGTSLIGAGLGGCVLSLVEKDKAASALENIKKDFYHKSGFEESAEVYLASTGSGVIY